MQLVAKIKGLTILRCETLVFYVIPFCNETTQMMFYHINLF